MKGHWSLQKRLHCRSPAKCFLAFPWSIMKAYSLISALGHPQPSLSPIALTMAKTIAIGFSENDTIYDEGIVI